MIMKDTRKGTKCRHIYYIYIHVDPLDSVRGLWEGSGGGRTMISASDCHRLPRNNICCLNIISCKYIYLYINTFIYNREKT